MKNSAVPTSTATATTSSLLFLLPSSSSSSSSSSLFVVQAKSLFFRKSCCRACSKSSQTHAAAIAITEEEIQTAHHHHPNKFSYRKASPLHRWPDLHIHSPEQCPQEEEEEEEATAAEDTFFATEGTQPEKSQPSSESGHYDDNILALAVEICRLPPGKLVGEVLDKEFTEKQIGSADCCSSSSYLLNKIGHRHWQRALEVYEWLQLKYFCNFAKSKSSKRMVLAAILSILGQAKQVSIAQQVFDRADPSLRNCVRVYNAIMSVYAKHGLCDKVQDLLNSMRSNGCNPDSFTFNILINARVKSGSIMETGSAAQILQQVRASGLNPDLVTYNTLISACAGRANMAEAAHIFTDMKQNGLVPDLWTYNAMISGYGRAGMDDQVAAFFDALLEQGLSPDTVTYNALLHAISKNGAAVEQVHRFFTQMKAAGIQANSITFNTLIQIYGRHGWHEKALEVYQQMKEEVSGHRPDAVTFSILIDFLGKAGNIQEAQKMFDEMSQFHVKPTLEIFSALICAYAKAGMLQEAEKTYDCMETAGVVPDLLANSVTVDILMKARKLEKGMKLYRKMVQGNMNPDLSLYASMIKAFSNEGKMQDVTALVSDMESCGIVAWAICAVLIKGGCYEVAAQALKLAASRDCFPDHEGLLAIFNAYPSSEILSSEGCSFLSFFDTADNFTVLIHQALIVTLSKAKQIGIALTEFRELRKYCAKVESFVYEHLLTSCEQTGMLSEASQLYSDMKLCDVNPTNECHRCAASVYSRLGSVDSTSCSLPGYLNTNVDCAQNDSSTCISLIQDYGKQKLWQKAENVFAQLRSRDYAVDCRAWNALIHAYAESGCYQQARAAFNQMLEDGIAATVQTVNGLVQAAINAGVLDQLRVLIEDIQRLGFKISRRTILLMLNAFAKAGHIREMMRTYEDMKAVGYLPNMQTYRILVHSLCMNRRLKTVEAILDEMKTAGLKADLSIYKATIGLYLNNTRNLEKGVETYQRMKADGFSPDEATTYEALICLYSRLAMPVEASQIYREMRSYGHMATIDCCRELLSACCRQDLWEECESLFKQIKNCCKPDRPAYHIMLKAYRNGGKRQEAFSLLSEMKTSGETPNLATMRILMDSCGKVEEIEKAEAVHKELLDAGLNLGEAQYAALIDAYLKVGDHTKAIQKLLKMKEIGIEPDCRTWTCVCGAASICKSSDEAINLLNALDATGFSLPISLLKKGYQKLISQLDKFLERIKDLEEEVAFGFINSLEDLLWAFERRAAAACIFHMAVQKKIYPSEVFWVKDKNWGADLRRLSAGAALVALTLWLDLLQDTCLQGEVECSRTVKLITGRAIYENNASLFKTVKTYLWEMKAPFFLSQTQSGVFVAKGYSVCRWIKDSPFCLDLELKDSPFLPKQNAIEIYKGSFMRASLVPAVEEIEDRLGGAVPPHRFSRFALLSPQKRDQAITAYLRGKQRLREIQQLISENPQIFTRRQAARARRRKPETKRGLGYQRRRFKTNKQTDSTTVMT